MTKQRKILEQIVKIVAIMTLTVAMLVGTVARAADSAAQTPPARSRFLVLDARIIETAENAKLTLGKAVKSEHNPLMAEDKPWEKRFDNLYPNVIYDKEAGLYKCWYSPFIVDNSVKGMTPEERKGRYRAPRGREMAICYAVSKNGIQWEKPELGLVEFENSTRNNIVWRGPHGAGVFKDTREPDPARRYKMMFKAERLSVAFSADGIHWSKAVECPEANVPGDTHNNAIWVPTLDKYVGITRTWGQEHVRQVARIESSDFLKWTQPDVVLEGLDKDHQTYSMPVFFHGGVYLGLVAIHDQKADRVWAELTWSPDTVQWNRVCPGTPLIANSEAEMAYDWGCIYPAACPVFLEDEIRIYYGGSDGHHYGWRNGFLCMATLRPDGWAGYEPIDSQKSGIVVTRPVVCHDQQLRLTADAADGLVQVSVLDAAGKLVATGKPLGGNTTDAPVVFEPADALKAVEGQPVRLKFELRRAKLYSFAFERSSD